MVGRLDVTRLRTSSGERGVRWDKVGEGVRRGDGVGSDGGIGELMQGVAARGWEKEDLMSFTFLSKKLAKSSGRREEGGGGGGGWRSEEILINNLGY